LAINFYNKSLFTNKTKKFVYLSMKSGKFLHMKLMMNTY